jgi:hypothetical protein
VWNVGGVDMYGKADDLDKADGEILVSHVAEASEWRPDFSHNIYLNDGLR